MTTREKAACIVLALICAAAFVAQLRARPAGPSVEYVEITPAPRIPDYCTATDLVPEGLICVRPESLVPGVVAESLPDVLTRGTDGSR